MYKVIEEQFIDITKPKYKLVESLLSHIVIIAHFYARIDAYNVARLLNNQQED